MADPSEKIKVTLVKSPIGARRAHRDCVQGLGLTRMHQTVELENTPAVRGMIRAVRHLLAWEPRCD
jgi:large subunit ribosomal protein L30